MGDRVQTDRFTQRSMMAAEILSGCLKLAPERRRSCAVHRPPSSSSDDAVIPAIALPAFQFFTVD